MESNLNVLRLRKKGKIKKENSRAIVDTVLMTELKRQSKLTITICKH